MMRARRGLDRGSEAHAKNNRHDEQREETADCAAHRARDLKHSSPESCGRSGGDYIQPVNERRNVTDAATTRGVQALERRTTLQDSAEEHLHHRPVSSPELSIDRSTFALVRVVSREAATRVTFVSALSAVIAPAPAAWTGAHPGRNGGRGGDTSVVYGFGVREQCHLRVPGYGLQQCAHNLMAIYVTKQGSGTKASSSPPASVGDPRNASDGRVPRF